MPLRTPGNALPTETTAHFIAYRRTHWKTGREEYVLVTPDTYRYAEDAQAQADEWSEAEYADVELVVLKAAPVKAAA